MHQVLAKNFKPTSQPLLASSTTTFPIRDNRGETIMQRKLIKGLQGTVDGSHRLHKIPRNDKEIIQGKFSNSQVIQRVEGESDLETRARAFLTGYKTVSPSSLKWADPEIDNPVIALFTGPITNAAAHAAEVATSKMPQHIKALVPWSHKRKNWMRAVNAIEGTTDIAFNGAALGAEAMTLGAAGTGTAGIGAGYKTGFSGLKSWIRREHIGRAASKAASVATSEFAQGLIPVAGSTFGILAGAKELLETTDLDAIAPERKGERAILRILHRRLEECTTILREAYQASPDMDISTAFQESSTVLSAGSDRDQEFEDTAVVDPDLESIEGQFQNAGVPIGPALISPKTVDKLKEALVWLLRQKSKSIRRFKRIDEKDS